MKNVLLLTSVILLLMVAYFVYAVYSLNKEEYYYGIVNEQGTVDKLVDKDNDTVLNYQLAKEDNNIKKGRWIKVTYTENKGTIVEQKNVDEKDVPKSVKDNFKQWYNFIVKYCVWILAMNECISKNVTAIYN